MRKYNINMVSREHLDKVWNQVKDYLAEGLMYSEGELDISHLRLLIASGKVQLVVGSDYEDNMRGALALEIVQYPNFRAANIISYGGYNLFAEEEDFTYLLSQLRMAGISSLQGWCKPAQARLFKSKYGFSTPYEMIRISTEEK